MNVERLMNYYTNREPTFIGKESYRESAVLIPLIEKEDGIHLLFEVRSLQMRSQPGDVCFPGGRIDATDPSAKDCAIRETSEELGIPAESIHSVVPFDYIISDIGTCIYPFIGKLRSLDEIVINEAEVAEVFTVPFAFFLEEEPATFDLTFQPVPSDDFPYELIHGGENYNWRPRAKKEHFYQYDGKVIWGLTAHIVKHFVEMTKQLLREEEAMK